MSHLLADIPLEWPQTIEMKLTGFCMGPYNQSMYQLNACITYVTSV